tara:strand:- start:48 stop:449 length:402 start_codon:yes stop_codon:yes gene_type:complete
LKPKTLEEIFNEAIVDCNSANLNGKGHESRMMHGVKISKDKISGEIKIFNPRGKDYDEELTPQEYLTFQQGWRIGVYKLVLKVYRNRLDLIQKRMAEEMNNKKSQSSLKGFRDRRLSLTTKYFQITQKLNQLL